jgi:hypothetical protein
MPENELTEQIFPSEYVSIIAPHEPPSAAEQVDKIRGDFEEAAKAAYGTRKPYRTITRAKVVE